LFAFQQYSEAALSFEHAAHIARDRHLKALARLGEGNSRFRDGTGKDVRPPAAMARLRAAIAAYRAALQLEPDLFNAEVNRKVAERRLRDLQQKAAELPPDRPGSPPGRDGQSPPPNADQILRESGRPPVPRVLAKAGGVDKDW
jgi:tetratricopeptide (TPR) repeat protein